MKAVVVEIKDGYAALLQDDGRIVKTKNRNYLIGDRVSTKENANWKKGKLSALVAVAAMFIIFMGAGVWAYATPYYYVSLDVNPSVLIEVNLFERVIGMEAVNEDAVAVLEGLDLKNKDIEEAITMAVARIAEAGYLDEEGGNIMIAAAGKNEEKAGRMAERLGAAAKAEAEENSIEPEVAAKGVGYQMVQLAKANGITPGKLNIAMNVLGLDLEEEGVLETIKSTSVKDLMAAYKNKADRALDAQEDEDSEVHGEPAEKAGLKGKNAQRKAEQAGRKDGNTAVETPAATNRVPNANGQSDAAYRKSEAPTADEDEVEKTEEAQGAGFDNKPATPKKHDVPARGKP